MEIKKRAENGALEMLREELRRQMNDVTNAMANGVCSSFPDYTNKTGIIEGFARAERALLDLDDDLIKA
jgi:hypothetical protein